MKLLKFKLFLTKWRLLLISVLTRIDNDQLLNQIMSQDIMHVVANSVDICDVKKSCVNDCNKCLDLEIELFKKKDFVEKEAYDKLVKSYSNLEKHCISLELATQLNQEIFQRENSGENLNAPTFNQLFKINELKAQSQEQDTVIRKLKERIKSLSRKDNVENSLENSNLNAQLQEKVFAITTLKNELMKLKGKNVVNTVVSKPNATLAPGMFKLDIEPISARLKNNRDAHEVYIEKTIEYVDTLRRFVERARTQYPSEPLLKSPCMFTKHVHELLVYASQICPNSPKPSEKLVVVTPSNKDKRVRFAELVTSSNNIPKQTDSLKTKDSNKPLLTSTRVKSTTSANGSKPLGNTKNNRITRPPRSNQKNKVEDHHRKVKSSLNKTNFVSEPISNALVKHSVRNAKFESMITPKKIVHLKETTPKSAKTSKPEIKVYSMRPKQIKSIGSSKKAKIVESKIANNSKHTHLWGSNATDVPSSSSLINDSKFLGTIRFKNDQVVKIMGYGDYQQGNVIISRVYYVEGLKHNLFSVGQFCDADLEVTFRKNTCFIRNLEGVDLLSGSRDTNLYTISLDDMLKASTIFLLSKDLKTKSWLWHRRLSHLNFGTLNKLTKDGLARAEDTNQEKLYLLHMDLCGPMRVESIKGKKYILLMHDKIPDLSFFHVFGSLCYPTNDSEDLDKLNAKADIGIFVGYTPAKKAFTIYNRRTQKIIETIHVTFDELTTMASEQFVSGPGLQVMTPATSSSRLIPNIIPQQPCNPPKRDDWDTLFQLLFDEYLNPTTITVSTVPVAAAPRAVEIADSAVSMSISHDAPSSSIPST
ncbi:retrovirus-related pol polyprotein from transposon TNT 1-94 [Tanacetum coccineum]